MKEVKTQKIHRDSAIDQTSFRADPERTNWFSPEFQPDLVSVVVPTYNRAHVLPRALDSLLAQTYRPLEIIVFDDGSNDGTSGLLADFQARCAPEPGITTQVVSAENQGAPIARNSATRRSRGEFIAYLDSDDLFAPTKLSLQVKALSDHPSWRFCYGPVAAIEQPGKPAYGYRDMDFREAVIRQLKCPFFSTLGPLFRRGFLNGIGPWCETLERCQDWELHSRMLMDGPDFGWVPKAWAYFRRDADGDTRLSDRGSVGVKLPDARTMRCRAVQLRSAAAHAPDELKRDRKFRMILAWELMRLARTHIATGQTEEGQVLLADANDWARTTVLQGLAGSAKMVLPVAGPRPTVYLLSSCEWMAYRMYAIYLRVKRVFGAFARRTTTLERI